MKKKLKAKFLLLSVFAAIIVVSVLAGCSKKVSSIATGSSPEDSSPTPIIFYRLGIGYDTATDPVVQELEKRTNTKITFITAPWDQDAQRVNVLLASRQNVDIMSMSIQNVNWNEMAEKGAFIQMDDLLATDKWPVEKKLAYNPSYSGFLVKGKCYGIPQPVEPGGGWVYAFRQDWLDNLGLSMPETADDLYNVMKAFTYNDPDKNGKNDTSATTLDTINQLFALTYVYSPPTPWLVINGELVYTEISENYRQAMLFINKLYNEKIVNQDIFAVKDRNTVVSDFTSGKIGMIYNPSLTPVIEQVRNNFPGAKMSVARIVPHDPKFTNGAVSDETGCSWMHCVLPASCSNPSRCMDLLEYLNSFDGRALMCYGIQGKNYKEIVTDEQGDFVAMGVDRSLQNDQWAGDATAPLSWGLGNTIIGYADFLKYPTAREAVENYKLFTSDLEKASNPFYDQRKLPTKVLYPSALRGSILPSDAQYGARITSIRDEYRVALITGSPNMDTFTKNWNEYVNAMNSAGVKQLTVEANELYKSLQ